VALFNCLSICFAIEMLNHLSMAQMIEQTISQKFRDDNQVPLIFKIAVNMQLSDTLSMDQVLLRAVF